MKDEVTPEMIAMARRVVAGLCGDSAAGREAAELYLRGYCDDAFDVKAALAAIIETTELAAKLAEWAHMVPPDGGSPTDEEVQLTASIAADLRAGAHLKGQNHG